MAADPAAVLGMKAKTFFALLNEGHKAEIAEKKLLLSIVTYPHMDKEAQEEFRQALLLPDDILSDILEEENIDSVDSLKSMFEE